MLRRPIVESGIIGVRILVVNMHSNDRVFFVVLRHEGRFPEADALVQSLERTERCECAVGTHYGALN